MSKEKLVQAVKKIVSLNRDGKQDEAFAGYKGLFEDPDFLQNRPEDQRQALRLMVNWKAPPPKPSQPMIDAHRAAVLPLTELVSRYEEPGDYEMLGMCHQLLGNEESAGRMYRAGLTIERQRSAGSDLCGALMRRVSEI
jgi:hypothetical protein